MKNRLIKFLTKCFGRKRNYQKVPTRILIVSTTGFGDSLWATPALAALDGEYVAVLTSPIGAKLFENNPHIHDIFTCPNNAIRSFFPLLRALRAKRFDTVYLFHASQRPIFPLIYWTGAGEIVGNQGMNKGLDCLFTTLLPQKREHEILRRLRLIGKEDAPKALEVFLKLAPLKQEPCICLHPGAKDAFKFWPKEHFIELGRRIHRELGYQVYVSGTPGEKALVESIKKEIPGAKAAIYSLNEFAALLKSAAVFVTNDTGPMHLAFALNVPTLVPFCPTDPKLCGPLEAKAEVIYHRPTCTPCLKKRCHQPICMYQIGVDSLWSSLLSLIGTEKKTPSPAYIP